MTDAWRAVIASEVEPGDRVRLGSGALMTLSLIETGLLGMPGLLAFIEDTPTRWYKHPIPASTTVEVCRPQR
jgi:hypothetical protein